MTTDERLREEHSAADHKLFRCIQCGFEYDEALGWPEDGIPPGTRWEDIPDDWSCPDCGAAKADFEMVEIARS
jgi:rubredoxin